jgi:two-component system cell cycle sensor histidine kinase/response regulator CckA
MTSYRVLVVEDEGLIARDIASRLEALGHTVAGTVGTAKEAIEHAPGADIVLMDIRLDGPADGIEAATQIRERYHLPVVFLTAHADRSTLERAKLAAPFGYIVKPLAHAALQTTLEIAIYKHRMERELAEREAWLSTTLASVTDAVIVTDPQGNVRMINRAAEDLLDKNPAIPEDTVTLAILQDGPIAIETQLQGKTVEGSAAPVKASGRTIGAVLTLRDVSARKREEQQRAQAQRAEVATRLAAGLANDYASLIGVIRTRSEQLLQQFADYAPVRQPLEEIQQAAAAADQITRRLAGLSAQPPGHPEVLSLNGILRRMSKLIESIAGSQIRVVLALGANLSKLYADTAQVEETVMTLVIQAAKAMPEGGQLTVETADADGQISLSVTHTGPPHDSGDMDLWTARYLTASGNRLEALFPKWAEPPSPPAALHTLLLIEPRERIRGQLHTFFEANGFNLLEAADQQEAAALLELHEVDLVVAEDGDFEDVRVLHATRPYTQQELLAHVRAALEDRLAISASAP